MTPRETIRQIDKQINSNRSELRKRFGKFDTHSASGWQAAWDAHPDLHDNDHDLCRQRGLAQHERDIADEKVYRITTRKNARNYKPKPMKKCPTCGCHTLAA